MRWSASDIPSPALGKEAEGSGKGVYKGQRAMEPFESISFQLPPGARHLYRPHPHNTATRTAGEREQKIKSEVAAYCKPKYNAETLVGDVAKTLQIEVQLAARPDWIQATVKAALDDAKSEALTFVSRLIGTWQSQTLEAVEGDKSLRGPFDEVKLARSIQLHAADHPPDAAQYSKLVQAYFAKAKAIEGADGALEQQWTSSGPVLRRATQLRSQAWISTYFGPLLEVQGEVDGLRRGIDKDSTVAAVRTRVLGMGPGFAALKETDAVNAFKDAVESVRKAEKEIDGILSPLDVTQEVLSAKPFRQPAKEFTERYGLAGCRVLLRVPDVTGLQRFLDIYSVTVAKADFNVDVKPSLKEKVLGESVTAAIGASAPGPEGPVNLRSPEAASTRTLACQAAGCAANPSWIAAPGVRVIGERITVGAQALLYPSNWSDGDLTTTSTWVRHLQQETGGNPTKEKLTAYLAEAVAACQAADKIWKSGLGGKEIEVEMNSPWGGKTTWRVAIHPEGKERMVHHLDSGYENSPWVTAQVQDGKWYDSLAPRW